MQSVQVGLIFGRSGQQVNVEVPAHMAQVVAAQQTGKAILLSSGRLDVVHSSNRYLGAQRPQ